MPSILKRKLKTTLAQSVVNAVKSSAGYYSFLGKVDAWPVSDLTPETPIDTVNYENKTRRNIVSIKRVGLGDVCLGVKRYDYISGTVYDIYDDLADLSTAKWYAISAGFNVYACLWNNGGTPSLVQPEGKVIEPMMLDDGYIWQYLYTIPAEFQNKFMTGNTMPVFRAYENAFYTKGTISSMQVINGGSGYVAAPPLYISGDGYLERNPYKLGMGSTTSVGSQGAAGTSVTLTAANGNIAIGMVVTGTNVPYGTVVQGISSTTLTLSQATTVAIPASTTLYFGSLVDIADPGFGYTATPTVSISAPSTKFSDTNRQAIAGAAITSAVSGNMTYSLSMTATVASSTGTNIIYVASTAGLLVGTLIKDNTGINTYIPNNTKILSVTSKTIKISNNLTQTLPLGSVVNFPGSLLIYNGNTLLNGSNGTPLLDVNSYHDMSNASWVKGDATKLFVDSNAGVAPDGSKSADLVSNALNATSKISQPSPVAKLSTGVDRGATTLTFPVQSFLKNISTIDGIFMTDRPHGLSYGAAIFNTNSAASWYVRDVIDEYRFTISATVGGAAIGLAATTYTWYFTTIGVGVGFYVSGSGISDLVNTTVTSITINGTTATITLSNALANPAVAGSTYSFIPNSLVLNATNAISSGVKVFGGSIPVNSTVASTPISYAYQGTVTSTVTTNILTFPYAHNLKIGDPIVAGATAGGLTSGTVYYVASTPTTLTATISATKGGTVFPLTTASGLTLYGKSTTVVLNYSTQPEYSTPATQIKFLATTASYVYQTTLNQVAASAWVELTAYVKARDSNTTGILSQVVRGTTWNSTPDRTEINDKSWTQIKKRIQLSATAGVTTVRFDLPLGNSGEGGAYVWGVDMRVVSDYNVYDNVVYLTAAAAGGSTMYYSMDNGTTKVAFANVGANPESKFVLPDVVATTGSLSSIFIQDAGYGYDNSAIINVTPPVTNSKAWKANVVKLLGDIISYNGYHYKCLNAGALGSYPPVTAVTYRATEVNGQVVLSCIAKNPSVSLSYVKTEATATAISNNGIITGVTITDGGVGYTRASVTFATGYGGSGAILAPIFSGDLFGTEEHSNVENSAQQGEIVSVIIDNPGSGFTSEPTVVISGDGSGAEAVAYINSDGTLKGIRMTSTGFGYTYANVSLTDLSSSAGGYVIRAVVAPEGGFGNDAPMLLGANSVVFSSAFDYVANVANNSANTSNQFRQSGLLFNPQQFESGYRFTGMYGTACHVISLDTMPYVQDELLTVKETGAQFIVVDIDTGSKKCVLKALNNNSVAVGNTLLNSSNVAATVLLIQLPDITTSSGGDLLTINNNAPSTVTGTQFLMSKTVLNF